MNRAARTSISALLPGLLLAFLSLWFGTLPGGATWMGSVVGFGAILMLAMIGAPDGRDPLLLGRRLGLWLPLALVATTTFSWYLSPVGRAGEIGVLLLPAFLLAPAGVARCWHQPRQLELGLDSISATVATVAVWSFIEWIRLDSTRAAMPLGHHNLLAGWLVVLTPLAATGLRRSGLHRWLSGVALVLGVGAILATGSLIGITALVLQGILAAFWWPKLRIPLAATAAIGVLTQIPRGLRILTGSDLSAAARLLYLQAARDGFLGRPVWGWGPGSSPWLIARHLEPSPQVNPPSQVVGDFHSMPAQLAFELGLAGLALSLSIWLLFTVRRWRGWAESIAAPELGAPLVGLAGGSLYLLVNAPVTVLAIPLAFVVACGAALATESRTPGAGAKQRTLFAWLILLAVAALLLPKVLAQFHYDRAVAAETDLAALDEVARAGDLDPEFPLYGARTAWLRSWIHGADSASAGLALRAAEAARGLAPLWLAAGFLGLETQAAWTLDALQKAHDLDPLSPLPPFLMALSEPERPESAEWAARAIRAEPALSLTAPFLERIDLRLRTIDVLRAAGTEERLIDLVESGAGERPPAAFLGLSLDRSPAQAFSLYGFRRRPWPATPVRLPFRHQETSTS